MRAQIATCKCKFRYTYKYSILLKIAPTKRNPSKNGSGLNAKKEAVQVKQVVGGAYVAMWHICFQELLVLLLGAVGLVSKQGFLR